MSARSNEKCPLCGRPAEPAARPFCSSRCRDRDLLNWLGDAYRMPGPPAEEFTESGLDSEA